MAGLKTATGEEIDGSFELRVEVEAGHDAPQRPPAPPSAPHACPQVTPARGPVTLSGGRSGGGGCSAPPPRWRRWGSGGGSRLRFAPRYRPLRLRLPRGGVLRLRLDFAATPGRAVAVVCGLLGVPHPEELSLLRPEGGEGRGPPDLDLTHLRPWAVGVAHGRGPGCGRGPWAWFVFVCGPWAWPGQWAWPVGVSHPGPAPSWLDVGRALLEQDVAEDEELELRFKYPCAVGLDPQEGPRVALLQEEALGEILSEELECSEEQGLRFAALQYLIEGEEEGAEWGDPPETPETPKPTETPEPDLNAALERLELSLGGGGTPEARGAPPELEEELEILSPSPWPFRGSRPSPTRAVLRGSSLSLWTPPSSGGPQQQLNLRGSEVTPQVDLGAQKFGIKLRLPGPGGGSETLLRCRDAPQFARWVCGCRAAAFGEGSPPPPALRAQLRGVLGVLGGGRPQRGDPPGTPPRDPPDPRRLLPPRLQRRLKGQQFPQRLLPVLLREGPLSPPQARLRFLQEWRALPGFGLGLFVVRFRGAPRDELLALGPSRLSRVPIGPGGAARGWSYRELERWDVNWDSGQVRLWLRGDLTLALRVLSAPPRALHQFLGGYLALGGAPRDPRELRRLMEGGLDP
ncbi:fermitin family homolog 3-like [Taeniopygia guttata]|uniref:fermitin family homolog 3-like n=1 Tax=Taeniopygia guttata TaxID=59729 RepID=UPI003BB8D5E7